MLRRRGETEKPVERSTTIPFSDVENSEAGIDSGGKSLVSDMLFEVLVR